MPIAVIQGKVVVFAHVPKTGGSSVERYLSDHGMMGLKSDRRIRGFPCSMQHLHSDALAAMVEVDKADLNVMLVRHPVARIASEYRYQMRKRGWLRDRLSFSGWLRYTLTRRALNPYYRDNHFRPQHEFELPGAEVFRFEDGVDTCIATLAERLGTPAPATSIREKPSPRRDFAFTARDLARIETVYAQDFARYGYEMGRDALLEAGLSADMIP
ncbi:hypothetical protein roselon_03304 [Roseibacterium elongatum DSM 19469]|uniref:Sulfotransferase family protein n=1 Tax=Roseicyclus elongatus DSM 19469 TaxID=1294273 RepID=W8S5R3_9RHOB|nr:sulfotransferase family 2 domain-containing protein [Roseibacterium elongatum]AHM05562.1 hypothetical protein roselon_03304 [Roseibacterium elongatum DSM 19469]